MRPLPAAIGVTIAVVVGLSACSRGDGQSASRPSEEFCEAAIEFERGLEQQVDLGEQIRLLEAVVETAPGEIEADARTFLDALEVVRAEPDDAAVVDDPDVEEAVENVERYVIDACALFERDGGGSPF